MPIIKQYIILNTIPKFVSNEELERRCGGGIKVYDYFTPVRSRLVRCIRKVHCSNKVNSVIPLPGRERWSVLRKIQWDDSKEYCVAFFGIFNTHLTPEYLKQLQRQHNISYVMVLFDIMSSPHSAVERYYMERVHFDHVFTFDTGDAEKYGFHLVTLPYAPIEDSRIYETEYDLYYVGRNALGRLDTLRQMCEAMPARGVCARFRLTNVPAAQTQRFRDTITYNRPIDYETVVQEVKRGNCILELQLPGQVAQTLRYHEAVCYNKKLLTNNHNVVDLPFYDPRYMKVFESVEDIDWDWVRDRSPVDYHYDGSFSYLNLIEQLLAQEEKTPCS